MRYLLSLTIMLFSTIGYGQVESPSNSFLMTHSDNENWLTLVKGVELSEKLTTIQNRLLLKNENTDAGKVAPLFIINGILISDTSNQSNRKRLATFLAENKIDVITIIDILPDQLYVERPFTGMILIKLNDRKAKKNLKKLKF